MDIANLTRYNLEWFNRTKTMDNFHQMVASDEGVWVKFEEAVVASSNSLQHLKAEISGVLDSMQYRVTDGIDAKTLQFYINELRQKLSAVE